MMDRYLFLCKTLKPFIVHFPGLDQTNTFKDHDGCFLLFALGYHFYFHFA